MDDLFSQAGQILTKINGIPISEIGRDVQTATSRLSKLVSSPHWPRAWHT